MGTVAAFAVLEALSVSVELPLASDEALKDALTPEGRPRTERLTVP